MLHNSHLPSYGHWLYTYVIITSALWLITYEDRPDYPPPTLKTISLQMWERDTVIRPVAPSLFRNSNNDNFRGDSKAPDCFREFVSLILDTIVKYSSGDSRLFVIHVCDTFTGN